MSTANRRRAPHQRAQAFLSLDFSCAAICKYMMTRKIAVSESTDRLGNKRLPPNSFDGEPAEVRDPTAAMALPS